MESEEEMTADLTRFEGQREFTIVNACKSAISKVRVTHFLKDNSDSEFFIQENMAPGAAVDKVLFYSYGGKNDNWTVSFQLGKGCFMCGKLDKSMQDSRSNYKLVISEREFAFQYVESGHEHRTFVWIESIFNILNKFTTIQLITV